MELGSELECIQLGASIRDSDVPSVDLREVQTQQGYCDSNWEQVDTTIARSLPSAPIHDCLWFLTFELAILRKGVDDFEPLKGP